MVNYSISGKNLALPKESEELSSEGPVLIPIENYEDENQILDNIEENISFSVISGSEFSRQVSFICEVGCSKEFKSKSGDKELMCPHCGTIGESPL